jgi:menaquinone-dependent protoporphyrinogen IX oxidase
VVIGAPIIIGWHRAAQSFLKKHQKALSQMRVAMFATAMSLTQPAEDWAHPLPLHIDPDLAVAPKNPRRLSPKERYASVPNYLGSMLRAVHVVRPLSVAFFGGKLEMFRLTWWQALFVMVVIRAQPGDIRNWGFIKAWGEDLSKRLSNDH